MQRIHHANTRITRCRFGNSCEYSIEAGIIFHTLWLPFVVGGGLPQARSPQTTSADTWTHARPQIGDAVSTVDVTLDQFEGTVDQDGIVMVDFWAEWCGPCKSFAPVYEAAAERHDEVVFAKVDTEAEQQLAGMVGIQSIPTIMVFRDGVPLFRQAGALPADAIDDLISQASALDMEVVRKEMAEAEQSHDHGDHEHGPNCNH